MFLIPLGNAGRYWDGTPIRAIVTKIARKYFFVQTDKGNDLRFLMQNFSLANASETGSNYFVYPSTDAAYSDIRTLNRFLEIREVLLTRKCGHQGIPTKTVDSIYALLVACGAIKPEEDNAFLP